MRIQSRNLIEPVQVRLGGKALVRAGQWLTWSNGEWTLASPGTIPLLLVVNPGYPGEDIDVCRGGVFMFPDSTIKAGDILYWGDGELKVNRPGDYIVGFAVAKETVLMEAPFGMIAAALPGGEYGDPAGDTPFNRELPV